MSCQQLEDMLAMLVLATVFKFEQSMVCRDTINSPCLPPPPPVVGRR